MADKAVSTKLAKPQMRLLLHSSIKRNLTISISLAIAVATMYKFTVGEPRKKRYAEFYRTYDAEKDFQEMRKKGLFQSC